VEDELLTVAAVARRIGVAPATLRTWDRRYGLGPTLHEAGSHRRYCPADLAKLTLMRRLISIGVSPSDAAEQAKAHKGAVKIAKLVNNFEHREELVDALHRAASILDKSFIETVLRKDIAEHGVIASWTEVIVPLLVIVGDEWERTGAGIEVEHMLSELLKSIMREGVPEIKKPKNAQPVLLAAVGEEVHCLALHALAAALAERGIESFFLGARTPLEAIDAMVRRSAPPAIFLWAQLKHNGDEKFFREIPAIRPTPRIILGGPGWNLKDAREVTFVQDLSLACAEIESAVGF
jgi:MerR family transcriptional regulator, light-induced transcriptional regulator